MHEKQTSVIRRRKEEGDRQTDGQQQKMFHLIDMQP